MHHSGVNHHVVVDELRRPAGVGENAANGACYQEDVLRPVRLEPVVHSRLISQIELLPGCDQGVGKPLLFEAAKDCCPSIKKPFRMGKYPSIQEIHAGHASILFR